MVPPRIVIIGAGFGGLECARKLRGKPCSVLLVDQHNYHLFTPLLYQVASSLLNPSDIARPVRSVFGRSANVRFRRAKVTALDLEQRAVRLESADDLAYDYLVVATGSTTNYFGISSIEQNALGLKDLPEALQLRNHILGCLEEAVLAHPDEVDAWLTFVVVGGGPTGVEYAGALSELVRIFVPKEYPELDRRRVRIMLLEGADEVLPAFPSPLRQRAHRDLQRHGVEVRTKSLVSGYDGRLVELADGHQLGARTLVWAAGVKPGPLAEATEAPKSRSGRMVVDRYLRLEGRAREFAIGDAASFVQDGREAPMLSAPAMQEARVVAANILASATGGPLRPFRYRDRGSMATIGKGSAVAQIGRLHLEGTIGWLAWLAVHLYYIIGFRNRARVLAGWAWDYLRSDRPVRLITQARGE